MLTVEIPNAKNLRIPLSRVAAAVNRNTPIETCVYLEAEQNNNLLITAVDSRTHQLKLRVPESEIFTAGKCILTADIFNQMVSTLSDDPLQLYVDENSNQLVVHQATTYAEGTNIKLDLFTAPPEDFPVEANLPNVIATVDAERFGDVIKKALRLAERDEYITFVGKGDTLKVYTRGASGRLFSRTVLQTKEMQEEWSVAIPMQLLAKFPNSFIGDCEICMNDDLFAICVGQEHLISRQMATDTISYTIDCMVDKNTPNYWVVKADSLKGDLKRASFIKDKYGLKLARDKQALRATCGAPGRGNVDTPHQLVHAEGKIEPVRVDPTLFARAIDALECVDLVGEQVEEVVPSLSGNEDDMTIYNLRLSDQDAQDYRSIVITTIQV